MLTFMPILTICSCFYKVVLWNLPQTLMKYFCSCLWFTLQWFPNLAVHGNYLGSVKNKNKSLSLIQTCIINHLGMLICLKIFPRILPTCPIRHLETIFLKDCVDTLKFTSWYIATQLSRCVIWIICWDMLAYDYISHSTDNPDCTNE